MQYNFPENEGGVRGRFGSVPNSSDGLIFVKRRATDGHYFGKNTGVRRAKRRAKFKSNFLFKFSKKVKIGQKLQQFSEINGSFLGTIITVHFVQFTNYLARKNVFFKVRVWGQLDEAYRGSLEAILISVKSIKTRFSAFVLLRAVWSYRALLVAGLPMAPSRPIKQPHTLSCCSKNKQKLICERM